MGVGFLFKEVEMGRITRFSPVTGALATVEVCLNCVFGHIKWDVMGQLEYIPPADHIFVFTNTVQR